MDNESRKIISEYKAQIVCLLFSLFAVIVSIVIVKDLIDIEKGIKTRKQAQINKKSEIVALIVLVISIYFTYTSIKQYKKKKNKANLSFLIAVILGLIASFIKLITIYQGGEIEGVEDI